MLKRVMTEAIEESTPQWSEAKCRFVNARPEPDFKYFSNRLASLSVGNSIVTMTDHGRCRQVNPVGPALCQSKRSSTFSATPT